VLVFTGEPQKRSAFSQRTTPPQLSSNRLPDTSIVAYLPPLTRASPPLSEMYTALTGKEFRPDWNACPWTMALRRKVLLTMRAL